MTRNENSGLIDLDALNAEMVTREAAAKATAALDEMHERLLASGAIPPETVIQLSAKLAVARTRLVDVAMTGKRRSPMEAVSLPGPTTRSVAPRGEVSHRRSRRKEITTALVLLFVAGTTAITLARSDAIENTLATTARAARRANEPPARETRPAIAEPSVVAPSSPPPLEGAPLVVPPATAVKSPPSNPRPSANTATPAPRPTAVAIAPTVAAAAPREPAPPAPAEAEAESDPFGTPAADHPLRPAAGGAVPSTGDDTRPQG